MEPNNPAKKVLVAVRPKELKVVSDILGDEFVLAVCHTLADAEAQLDEDIGLIACGVHFDSGRMFDLLRRVRTNPKTKAIPFYLLLGSGKGYSSAIQRGIRSAAKLLGATGFTDLTRLRSDMGDQQAYERLREVIRQAL